MGRDAVERRDVGERRHHQSEQAGRGICQQQGAVRDLVGRGEQREPILLRRCAQAPSPRSSTTTAGKLRGRAGEQWVPFPEPGDLEQPPDPVRPWDDYEAVAIGLRALLL